MNEAQSKLWKEGLQHLQEQIDNFTKMKNDYLTALKDTFPDRGEKHFIDDSETLRQIINLIESTESQFRSAENNYHWYRHYRFTNAIYEGMESRRAAIADKHEKYAKAIEQVCEKYSSSYGWGVPIGVDLEYIKEAKNIPSALWYYYLDSHTGRLRRNKERNNWLQSYLIEPKFSVGDIVSLRSNITDNAIKYKHDWGNGCTDMRTAYPDAEFKKRAFMVLGEDNTQQTRYYEKTYKPNANGGMRRYKVLPIGDTTIYWIIERALKKNRTKAVKDAKGT